MLVVDDQEAIRDTLQVALDDEGFTVECASNGREALDLIGRWKPDVILLDLMMPVMDGWQFRVAQLQQDDLAAIPTVVCTARTDAEARAISMGAIAYLRKPLDFDYLLDLVEAHCPKP